MAYTNLQVGLCSNEIKWNKFCYWLHARLYKVSLATLKCATSIFSVFWSPLNWFERHDIELVACKAFNRCYAMQAFAEKYFPSSELWRSYSTYSYWVGKFQKEPSSQLRAQIINLLLPPPPVTIQMALLFLFSRMEGQTQEYCLIWLLLVIIIHYEVRKWIRMRAVWECPPFTQIRDFPYVLEAQREIFLCTSRTGS